MIRNSIIKPIRGICVDCEKAGDTSDKYLIAKRCKNHYNRYRNFISRNRKKARGSLEKDLDDSVKLNDFFNWCLTEAQINTVDRECSFCWECERKIYTLCNRSAIAHIFPKSIFRSVMTHEDNWLFLPAECCHDKTHRLDMFSKMKVFPEAVDRFNRFRSHITESHKYLDEFIKYANQLNLL